MMRNCDKCGELHYQPAPLCESCYRGMNAGFQIIYNALPIRGCETASSAVEAIASLRQALEKAEEAGARKMWEKSSKFCRRRSDQPPVWRCWRGTADCLDLCQFDTCPLRKEEDCHETY